jgi:predicted phage tail protein
MFDQSHLNNAGFNVIQQYDRGDKQIISVTDLISEGPIYGLVDAQASVYLNDDRAAPLNQSANPYNQTGAMVQLSYGSTTATIVNSTATPIIASTNGDKYLIVRAVHAVYGTASNGSTSDVNANTTATLTTNNNSSFFTDSMLSEPSTDISATVPVNLRLVTTSSAGQVSMEGTLLSRSSQSVAEFMPGATMPSGLIIPEGTYYITVDRIVKISTINGTTITLENTWPYTTTGSYQAYNFDVTGAIVLNSSIMSQTSVKKYKSVTSQFRVGTLNQEPFSGTGGVGATSIVSTPASGGTLELSTGHGGSQAPKELVGSSQQGFNLSAAQIQEVDEVSFTISYTGGLYAVDGEGNDRTTYATYKVELALKRPGETDFGSYMTLHDPFINSAVTKNGISFIRPIQLGKYRPFTDFKVKIARTSNHTGDGYSSVGVVSGDWQMSAGASLSTTTSIIKEVLTHPYSAMAKTTFDTKQFQSVPSRSFHVKGIKVLVPSNYITRDQASDGIASYTRNTSTGALETTYQDWDGAFAGEPVYTNNPAWVFYDILTNNRYGLGDFLQATDIDKYSLYRIARYCDEQVPDGKGGLEPRFTANLYFTKQSDAFKVIKDVATVFRSMIYFFDGQVSPVIDAPSGPVYNFTKANVIDGEFSYESTGSKTRINQVIVTWVNPDANYKAEPLIVEDKLNIAETGKLITQTAVAMGATSEGQALRYGRWKLWTAANQREVVSFKSSFNSSFLVPGDIINIQDADRSAVRIGGRISNTGSRSVTSIPLDNAVTLNNGSKYLLSVLFTEPGAFATSNVTIQGVAYKPGDLIKKAYIDDDGNGTYTFEDIDTEEKALNAKATSTETEALVLTWTDTTRVENREVDPAESSGSVDAITIKTTGNNEAGNPNTDFTSVPEADSIWVLTERVDGLDTTSSAKQYKILALQESSKGEISFSAVEHYDEKFTAVDEDFTTFVADTIYPAVTADNEVPVPLHLASSNSLKSDNSGEELRIYWQPPENVGSVAGTYEHLKGFEITHNFPDIENPIRILDPNTTSWTPSNIQTLLSGKYEVGVRTINILENLSDIVTISVSVTDRFKDGSLTRAPLGLPIGGTCSTTTQLSDTGIFSFKKNVYGFLSPQRVASSFIKNTSTAAGTYQLAFGFLPQITWTSPDIAGEFISEHHYIAMRPSINASVMKLLKYNKENSYNIPYWFDAGDGTEGVGTSSINGTIEASNSTKITGSGTQFLTDLDIGALLVVKMPVAGGLVIGQTYTIVSGTGFSAFGADDDTPGTSFVATSAGTGSGVVSQAAIVSCVYSDTVVYIDRPITNYSSTSTAVTNNYHFNYTSDTLIARVYKTAAGYNKVGFISIDDSLAAAMERSLFKKVAAGGAAGTYNATAGTFEDPAAGAATDWQTALPSLDNNNDIIYVITRIFTEDGQAPQQAQWSSPSVYSRRIDGLNSKTAVLTANQYAVPYGDDNDNDDTITFTAKAINFASGVDRTYKFYVGDSTTPENGSGSGQTNTDDEETFELDAADKPANGEQVTIRVDIEQNSVIIASDSTTIYGVKNGSDAFTVILTNETHVVPASETGDAITVGDNPPKLPNSGTDIRILQGSTFLTYDDSSPYAPSTFRVTAADDDIDVAANTAEDATRVTTEGVNGTDDNTRRYGNASNMTTRNASIVFTIIAQDAAGVSHTLTRTQTFTKAYAGTSAKVVNLTANKYVIPHNVDGNDIDSESGGEITFTATAKNITGNRTYKFYVGDSTTPANGSGGSGETNTSNVQTFDLLDNLEPTSGEQKTIRVDIEQNSVIIASDSTSVYGIQDGEDAFTVILTNEAHVIPATSAGEAKNYNNSGTDIRVFRGSTGLAHGTSGANTFSVAANDNGITVASGSNVTNPDSNTLSYGDAADMADSATTASITFTITARNQVGTGTDITRTQTFTKGNDGISSAVDIIFKRSATKPDTPDPSPGVPTTEGWSTAIPTTTTTALWASNGNKSGGATNYTWSEAYKVEAPVAAELQIFSDVVATGGSIPGAPTSSVYDFSDPTEGLDISDSNWNKAPSAIVNNGDTVYVCNALVTAQSPTETSAAVTWNSPVVYSKKTNGDPGVDGVSLNLTASPVLFTKDANGDYDPDSTSIIALSAFGGSITKVTWSTSAGTLTGAGEKTSSPYLSSNILTFGNAQSLANAKASATVTAVVTGTTSDNTTDVSFGTVTAKISTSIQGADGATPANALKTIQGYLYYEKTTANAPADPSGSTYTFSTGLVSGGSGVTEVVAPANTATNVWTNSPRTQDPTSSHDHYTIRYFGTQNSATSDEASVSYSDVVPYTNFDGVVTFSNGTFSSGDTTINGNTDATTIDGGNIRASSVTLDTMATSVLASTGTVALGTAGIRILDSSGDLRVAIGHLSRLETNHNNT